MVAIRVTCINKENGYHEDPHHAISMLGWVEDGTGNSQTWTRLQMYDWVKRGGDAYVRDGQGNRAQVVARESQHGTQYVRTIADRVLTDNLLRLPECR
ncbi:MAG TPA: DUF3892 domain-containing protein [Terriglobia bacterium]|jgi:hypothetical protein